MIKTKHVFLTSAIFILMCLVAVPAQSGPIVRVTGADYTSEYPLAKVHVTVRTADSIIIEGLNDDNLKIYEDGFRVSNAQIAGVGGGSTIYIVFSMDTSKSVDNQSFREYKNFLSAITATLKPEDKAALYHFDEQVVLLNAFAEKPQELVSIAEKLQNSGNKTLLLNALYDSLELLGRVRDDRRAIVVFTDGKDDGSTVKADDVIDLARKSNIRIYFIDPLAKGIPVDISRIATLSGGGVFSEKNPERITELYRKISSALESQYIIRYHTMLKNDGKEHNIEVRLDYDKIRDRASYQIKLEKDFFAESNLLVIILAATIIVLLVLLMLVLILSVVKGRCNNRSAIQKNNMPVPPERFIPDSENTNDELVLQEVEQDVISDDTVYTRAWITEKNTGKKMQVMTDDVCLGRGDECGIIVDGPGVSVKHARIRKLNNAFILFDMASDTGTYLNGKKLLRPRQLHDWDEIGIGASIFVFRGRRSL